MRIALIGSFLFMASQSAQAGPVLWRDIEAGMTREQVQSLYPAVAGSIHHKPKVTILENVQQVARCHPNVRVNHAAGTVSSVTIESRYRGFPKESCGEDAAKALLAKYGAATDTARSDQPVGGLITKGLFKGLDTSRNAGNSTQRWIVGGVLITFERNDPDVDDTWHITYELPEDIGL